MKTLFTLSVHARIIYDDISLLQKDLLSAVNDLVACSISMALTVNSFPLTLKLLSLFRRIEDCPTTYWIDPYKSRITHV